MGEYDGSKYLKYVIFQKPTYVGKIKMHGKSLGRDIDGPAAVGHTKDIVGNKWGGIQDGKIRYASQGGWSGVPRYKPIIKMGDTRYFVIRSISIWQRPR